VALPPVDVRQVVEQYLRLVDRALPGKIEGLYLVGSVALDDYQAGTSDIDFVAVAGASFTASELDRLEQVHGTLLETAGKPWFDGVYVTWRDLARNPSEVEAAPFTLEGVFHRERGFEANPSTWLTLRKHPLALRGPAQPEVWHDLPAIKRWNVDNLSSYWRSVARELDSPALPADDRLLDQAAAWCVPGVTRLHYTIATGDVTSKSGACHYGLAHFSERWHVVIREALGVRTGEATPSRSQDVRRADVRDFMHYVIDDANAIFSLSA
jgi:predicted nucleotidyltransferase